MKKISVSICVYAIAGWLIFLCLSISAQEFKTIQDGIEYAEMTREIDKVTVKMNLLRLDLTKVRLDVVHGLDSAIGTETVSSMAKRHGAIAAINAGFFRLDKSIFAGDADGVLMIDGKLWSESKNNRVGLLIRNDSKETFVHIGHLNLNYNFAILTKKGKRKMSFPVSGINRERQNDELIIYTPEFHRTTLTNSDGVEIIFQKKQPIKILDKKGNNLIPQNGFIISATGTSRKELLEKFNPNSAISLNIPVSVVDFSGKEQEAIFITLSETEDITNGVPQLIKNGKIEITWQEEKASKSFYETKHPRTAITKLKDGKFLMITVDGRSESSGGIGLEDLAKLLLEFGATDAMNLDGGGSTTMFLDGKIVNKPSDKEGERKVGDAILVFPRNKL